MDLSELSVICEQSLMWRLKPSPARTWSARWKRVSWMRHLSGRILKPSMRNLFETRYTSSLPAIRASHSVVRVSDRENQTPDTFGRILQESFRQLDLFGSSEKMLRDTLRSDSPKFIEAYEIWITILRQDYLARQSVERHIKDADCLCWPTMQIADAKACKANKRGNPHLNALVMWPTPNIPNRGTELSKKHRPKSGGIDLQSAMKMWPTPQASEYKGQSQRGQHRPDDRLTNKVLQGGQLDQDNNNMNGNVPGLWATPESRNEQGYQIMNGKRYPRLGAQARWATPTDPGKRGSAGNQSRSLLKDLKTRNKYLNPDWVEQLMGLPVGWTDCDC